MLQRSSWEGEYHYRNQYLIAGILVNIKFGELASAKT